MKIDIVYGDIFSISCDAYVNPTDLSLSGGGGLDRKIHQMGGPELVKECATLRGKMTPGCTEITSGGKLPVKYVLHTVSPRCADEKGGSYDLLAKCYQNILSKASGKSDIHHIALPLVGSGISGYSLTSPSYGDTGYSLTAVTILAVLARHNWRTLDTVTIVCSSQEKYDEMTRTYRWIFGKGISKRNRIRGSLLGGAVGDALGYPVEFHDAAGAKIRELILDPDTGKALISDDTQMTLFTACGLLFGYSRGCMKGIGADPWHYIGYAYQDWLRTQCPDHPETGLVVSWIRNIPELNARRAPGGTCLSALMEGGGSITHPLNNSKGCGGVMRIAPIALYGAAHGRWDQQYNMQCCAEAAAITHGHPLGWMSAAALGNILYDIMQNFSIPYAVQDTIFWLEKLYPEYSDTKVMVSLLRKAGSLADISRYNSSVYLVEEYEITKQLGQGWVGEEALAVGLFCALVGTTRGFYHCLLNAVGHEGDSDSTGSIAGQILGAYLGEEALERRWLKDLELQEVITEIADDLTDDCRMSEYGSYRDAAWVRKYLSCGNSTHIPGPGEIRSPVAVQIPWGGQTKNTRMVQKRDYLGNPVGKYEILIEDGIIYHVSQSKADAQTGFQGFGIVSLKYDDEKKAYTDRHGWIRKHEGGTVEGYYCGMPFTLLPDHANKTVQIISSVDPIPWIGTMRRRTDEWGNPIEVQFREGGPQLSVYLLEFIASSPDYLYDFFR